MMDEQFIKLQKQLKAARQSMTHARRVVFEALQDQEPQTMHQLVTACADSIDRATVYRTVSLFEQLGIVQRLQIGWKYKLELSDNFHHHHHHLTCSNCGKTIPLPEDEELEKRLSELAKAQNFTMHGHQLEIQGVCQACGTSTGASTGTSGF